MLLTRILMLFVGWAGSWLCATQAFAQNWTLDQPAPMQIYKDNALVTGSGMAPGPGLQATFLFEQNLPGVGFFTRGRANVVSTTMTIGGVQVFIWSQTLDPAQEQANNGGLWPLSRQIMPGMRAKDYKTEITDGSSGAYSQDHTVIPH